MNSPFAPLREQVTLADLNDPGEAARIEHFVAERGGTPFHRPAWLKAVERGTGQRALGLLAEKGGALTGWLPLTEVHSPVFGRALVSSGFAVGGGVLAEQLSAARLLTDVARELAARRSCSTIELRGGSVPEGWRAHETSHCTFDAPLAASDEAQLLAIPRKQRAEVRKGLEAELEVSTGVGPQDRSAHYAVYAESVRNLGTPVFPRRLLDAVLDAFGNNADILTVRHRGVPLSSVISLYHDGAVMPYWGGGSFAARHMRANERAYYALMLHARRRGCHRFDFGRSRTGSGPYHFKKNWGFEPQPLIYSSWTAPGQTRRDIDPASSRYSARIALWKRLPLGIANRLGPSIANGLA